MGKERLDRCERNRELVLEELRKRRNRRVREVMDMVEVSKGLLEVEEVVDGWENMGWRECGVVLGDVRIRNEKECVLRVLR